MSADVSPRRSLIRRIFSTLTFVIFPLLLIVAIVWTAVTAIGTFASNYQDYQEIVDRRSDYAATATALVPEDAPASHQEPEDSAEYFLIAQFATNTPDAPDQPESESIIATNTPDAPEPTAEPQMTATQAAVERTPIALPTFHIAPEQDIQEIAGTAVPPKAPVIPRDHELVNIVLLGGDDEITGDGTTRTDTMIIVSVNVDTGTVAMMSLPRDLFVYVPTPTMTRLNTVYGIGEAFGWSGGGFGLLRQTIFYNFGIQVHYYARVDISGLREIIDSLGGVDLAVQCNYQDYALVGADVPSQAVIANEEDLLYTLPVGYYHMTGGEALWYARTRNLTDDFDRGRRQQQLLRAVFRAARDNGQLSQLPTLWDQLTQVVETDLTLDVVLGLLPIALDLETSEIETFSPQRWYHTTPWQPPTGALAGQSVQLPNPDEMQQLFSDFYQPPTSSQVELAGSSIAVYNGTNNEQWDLVAADYLRSLGFNAYAAGPASEQTDGQTRLIDNVGEDKGSLIPALASELNINNSAVELSPDANRTSDYTLIVGNDYNVCPDNVLPPE